MAKPRSAGKCARKLERLLKVVAMLDQLGSLGNHGAIFFHAVAMGTTMTALIPRSRAAMATPWPKLPRVAATTPARSGCVCLSHVAVDQRAAQFEGANGRVVFMLDPGFSCPGAG